MIDRRTGGLLISAAAAAMFAAPVAAYAQQASRSYNVPAQGLDSALKAIAAVSGEQIIYEPASVQGKRSTAIVGNYSTDAAVAAALRGTGLSVSRSPRGVLVITTPAPQPEQVRGEGEAGSAAAEIGDAVPDDPLAQEIVVTGSHIRGMRHGASPLISIDREYIERSGFSTAGEMIEALPQNFAGGSGEDSQFAVGQSESRTFASTVNLRGLGTDSTLILLNGRRMAPSGIGGAIIDISAIPVLALERVEILTDGASAIYGADAIAGVANFILRKNYQGAATKVRLGALTRGGGNELQLSQIFGTKWDWGSALLSYEYHHREKVLVEDRPFVASSDKRRFGGEDFRSSSCFPGNIRLATGAEFGIPENQDGTELTEDALQEPNRCNVLTGQTLLPQQDRHSVFAHLEAGPATGITLYADGLYTDRNSLSYAAGVRRTLSVPLSNPFRQSNSLFLQQPNIFVDYSVVEVAGNPRLSTSAEAYSISSGVKVELPSGWSVDFGGTAAEATDETVTTNHVDQAALQMAVAQAQPALSFNPFSSTIDRAAFAPFILDPIRTESTGKVLSTSVIADGPVFQLPAGSARLAIGAELRKEKFDSGSTAFPKSDRAVRSLFGELLLPLIAPHNGVPAVSRLQLSLAARSERYSDFGTTTVGKMGVIWEPAPTVTLRGTYGASFKAPLLKELHSLRILTATNLPGSFDPRTDTVVVPVIMRSGGNPDLSPETARIFSLSASYKPVRRGRFDIAYVHVDFRNRISSVTNLGTIFSSEDALAGAGALVRNPSQQIIDEFVGESDIVNNFGVPLVEGSVGIAIDTGLRNIGNVKLSAIDLSATYGLDVGSSTLDFIINGSYLIDFAEALVSGTPRTERVDTFAQPVDLRVRGGLTWSSNRLSITGFLNYADSYKDERDPDDPRKIHAWLTADANVTYKMGASGKGPADGIDLSFVVRNLFNRKPPFANIAVSYDATNSDAVGRSVALVVQKRW